VFSTVKSRSFHARNSLGPSLLSHFPWWISSNAQLLQNQFRSWTLSHPMRLCCSRTSRGTSHVASDRYWESRAIFVSNRRRCRIRRRSTLLLPILRIVSTRHSGLRSQSPIPTQDIILSQLENPARKIRKDLVLAHEIYPKSAIMFSISVLFKKKPPVSKVLKSAS
jgi:hypothetical protein